MHILLHVFNNGILGEGVLGYYVQTQKGEALTKEIGTAHSDARSVACACGAWIGEG